MQLSMGTTKASDEDNMKRMLLDTNPYLLGITMVVSLLHTVFDFLAFKNGMFRPSPDFVACLPSRVF